LNGPPDGSNSTRLMRRFLDTLYRGSGALAALCLVAICGMVLLQVGANLIDKIAALVTGEPIGLVIPSYADFTGFFLAAASFFALAHALRAGSHIRVTLLLHHLSAPHRRLVELWCVAVSAGLTAYFTVYMALLVQESVVYGDVSPGMVPVPLWLPQSAMALGLLVLTIALLDEFVTLLGGGVASYEGTEDALLHEPGGED